MLLNWRAPGIPPGIARNRYRYIPQAGARAVKNDVYCEGSKCIVNFGFVSANAPKSLSVSVLFVTTSWAID